jgi:Protein of unknown function (DUF2628)
MPVFTIHGPTANGADVRLTDKFVFVRDGFHFWAFVFGPFWLIWNRLWLATIGWIIVTVGLHLGLSALGAGRLVTWSADLMVALLMGLEAASLQRWTFSRGKWHQLDIVVADDEEAAERRFFDRWTNGSRGSGYDPLTVDRGGPPPTRNVPGQPFSRPPPPLPQGGIIGLFPEPGAPR